MKPGSLPAAPGVGELAGSLEETYRRRIRSLASFIELARQVQAGERATRLNRQLLMASMGALDAGTGLVFRLEPDRKARLLEAIGVRRGILPGLVLELSERTTAALSEPASLEVLGGSGAEPWRALLGPVDPALEPAVLFRLGSPGRFHEFALIGNLAPGAPGDREDPGLYSALAGLVRLVSHMGEPAPALRRTNGTARPAGQLPAAPEPMIEELRRLEPALRRFVGSGPAIERILYDLIGVAGTSCPVLFEGESGTGKEQLARIIHDIACGAGAPFEAVNCGAIPEALVESELFGHRVGAFTGATREHRGVFERARGGTVFLDEIAEMPLSAQVKLLRVLQDGTFSPVGGEELRHCASRVIAATHRDLRREVAARRFREDLYYRLNVFPIRIPPLRERREDIPELVREFLSRHAAEAGRPAVEVEADAMRRLSIYAYPGNVRELQNIVRTLLVEARGAASITDQHVVAVFSRHRLADPLTTAGQAPDASEEEISHDESVGPWVLSELRRYFFNLALAERMLEDRRRTAPDRRQVPVVSRSGLTYYLHGECLRALAEEGWDREAATRRIARVERLVPKVKVKLDFMMACALDAARRAEPTPAGRLSALEARFPKLPDGYRSYLRSFAEEFGKGRWG